MGDLPEVLEQLSSRVDALERRVHALEHAPEALAQPDVQVPGAMTTAQVAAESASDRASSVFTVLGRAMLGVAGAYLLRAVAESSLIPRPLVATVAILYAIAWLVWAARSAKATLFARGIYAGASALILAPMLWELTLRFHFLSPAVAAGVLCVFVMVATVLAWEQDRSPAFWVAHGAAAIIALALSIATHVMVPFVAALLLMVLLCEYAVARDRGHGIRPLVAGVANVAVWMMIFIYAGPEGARADYPVLGAAALMAPACMLFLIGAAAVAIKTTLLQKKVTFYETTQAVIAFLLAASSVLYFQQRSGAFVLGAACLVLSALSYAVTFVSFRHAPEQRNFYVFAFWSAGLFLAGTLWALPPNLISPCLGLAALAAIILGVRLECMTLDFHGVVFLTAAAIASGLLGYSFHALAGPLPARPGWSIFLVSACAVLCYAIGKERAGEAWQQQVLHFVPALLAVFAVSALIAQGLLRLIAVFVQPDVFHVAFIRSLTVCTVALALAFGGALWERLEMTRIAYAALAFEAAKLLFEDLRNGRMEFTAASIFLFAVTLIGVPRLARMRHKH